MTPDDLPPGAPAPDLLGMHRAAGWTAVVIDHLDGPHPDLSPAPGDAEQTWVLLDKRTVDASCEYHDSSIGGHLRQPEGTHPPVPPGVDTLPAMRMLIPVESMKATSCTASGAQPLPTLRAAAGHRADPNPGWRALKRA
ncbi:hypothetical protein [Streptomyces fagopyri]